MVFSYLGSSYNYLNLYAMEIINYKGSKKLGVTKVSDNKQDAFNKLLELNNKIPYNSNLHYKFSDKLIQVEYESWVKLK